MLEIMLEMKRIPHLEENIKMAMWHMDANEVMTPEPVTIKRIECVRNIVNMLRNNTHNGFPVISNNQGTFLGTITRDEL